MEQGKGRHKRRSHSAEFKRRVVDACGEAGVSIASVALANGLNANVVRRWLVEHGEAKPRLITPKKSPMSERGTRSPDFVPVAIAPRNVPEIRIDIARAGTTIIVRWPGDAAGECAAWLREWLR